jgi:hypothetical protein
LLHGPLPGLQQEVPAAESMAFLVYLRHIGICDPLFITDCAFVKDTFDRGPVASSDGWFVFADIWRKIWKAVDDIGGDRVKVRWIPAHTSAKAVQDGRLTELDRWANGEADLEAKKGAKIHLDDDQVANEMADTIDAVKLAARFIGRTLTAIGRGGAECVPNRALSRSLAGRWRPRPLVDTDGAVTRRRGHAISAAAGRLRCTTCLRTAANMLIMCSVRCAGSAGVKKHALKQRGRILYCQRCGCYSEKKVRGLAATCRGKTAPTSALRRLRAGRHPLTGEVLSVEQPPQICTLVARRRRIQWKRPACLCWLCAMGRAATTGATEDQVSLLLR